MVPVQSSFARRLPWFIAGLAVLGMLATLMWTRGAHVVVAPAPVTDAAKPRPVAVAPSPASPASRLLVQEEQRPIEAPPLTPEQVEAEHARVERDLEANFRADPLDPVGGPEAEHALEDAVVSDAMTDTGVAPSDFAADCRRHACRITATFQKSDDGEDWALFYGTAVADTISSYQVVQIPHADGSGELRIYGVRR